MRGADAARGCLVRRTIAVGRTSAGRELFGGRPLRFRDRSRNNSTFGYIIDWALRASRDVGELIEVNPDETPLSQFATQRVRESAAVALPRIVDQLIN